VSRHFSLIEALPGFAVPIIEAVDLAQTRHRLFAQPGADATHVIVGVSGGADSVCLLHALTQLAPAWGLSLHAAHLDHALRPESRADAEFVADLAQSLGVEFHLRRLAEGAIAALGGGVEAAARTLRYAFLAETARAVAPPGQQPIVAVAHHMDDQAETVLMNLITGAGLQGLGGVDWVRPLTEAPPGRPVALVRPLLGVRRAQILAYLAGYGLSCREDATNQDQTRLRNHIRHAALPLLAEINPQIVPTLARTAGILAAEAERTTSLDRNSLRALCLAADPTAGRIVLDVAKFRVLDLAAQRGVLRQAVALLGLDLREAGFERGEELLWHVRTGDLGGGPHTFVAGLAWTLIAPSGDAPARLSLHRQDVLPIRPDHPYLDKQRRDAGPVPLPAEGVVVAAGGWTLHCASFPADRLPADWRSRAAPWRAYVDAAAVTRPVLTAPSPGMAFAPLGMGGRHKQLGDFFTDRKVPPALRKGWPIVVDAASGRIVWVCGLAVAHEARITGGTQRVRCFNWRRHVGVDPSTPGTSLSETEPPPCAPM